MITIKVTTYNKNHVKREAFEGERPIWSIERQFKHAIYTVFGGNGLKRSLMNVDDKFMNMEGEARLLADMEYSDENLMYVK